MAIGTTALIMGGLAVAGGAAKVGMGAKNVRDAKNDLGNYERQDITNPFEDLQISSLGANIERNMQAQSQSNIMDMIQMGGTRAIIGATGKVAAQNNEMAQGIAQTMDEQMINREMNIANQGVRNMEMMEARENADLAGLGQQLEVGRQDMMGGVGDIVQGGMFMANNMEGADPEASANRQANRSARQNARHIKRATRTNFG